MPYPELMVRPMREDLTNIGVEELKTPDDVEQFFQQKGPALLVINSVCGCAAGGARPAVALALESPDKPAHVATVFAGQDVEATNAARGKFPQLPPSSPSYVLFNDGEPTHYIPRHRIEGRTPQDIAGDLMEAFKELKTDAE